MIGSQGSISIIEVDLTKEELQKMTYSSELSSTHKNKSNIYKNYISFLF